jgi:hypothetical protein
MGTERLPLVDHLALELIEFDDALDPAMFFRDLPASFAALEEALDVCWLIGAIAGRCMLSDREMELFLRIRLSPRQWDSVLMVSLVLNDVTLNKLAVGKLHWRRKQELRRREPKMHLIDRGMLVLDHVKPRCAALSQLVARLGRRSWWPFANKPLARGSRRQPQPTNGDDGRLTAERSAEGTHQKIPPRGD